MTAELWYERFAELLGCDARPGAIAASIESLRGDLDRCRAEIPETRRRAGTQARDQCIRQMRNAAVNCGMSSTCAVAGWFELSTERKQENGPNET